MNELKRLTDTFSIPNILTIAQKFMNHERSLLNEITELRAKATADYDRAKPADVKEHLDASRQLAGRMGQLGQLAAQLRATGPIGGNDGAPLPGPTFEYVPAGS